MSGLVLASCMSFAQNKQKATGLNIPQVQAALTEKATSVDPDFLKAPKFNSKAFGDTLYFQDFANGLPTGWSITNNNANNSQWEWNTVYQNGRFSANTTAIASTSAANGFMSLPADFYNTPIPTTGAVAMDTYFESSSLSLTNGGLNPTGFPSVWITYQQSMRYCCSGGNRLVVQVSSDNFVTFQEYDATNAIAVNAASGSFSNIINISTAAANQADIKVRFLSSGNSHYYWMIDDFAVIEGPQNDVELREPYMEFNFDYAYNPFYGQIPYDLFPPLPMSGFLYNNGSNTLTGMALTAAITHDSFPGGAAGSGVVYSTSSTPMTMLSGIVRDTADYVVTNSPRFVPLQLGSFRVDMLATSDSIDENFGNEVSTQFFTTSDTVFARDDNGYGGSTGPSSYVRSGSTGGTAAGDRFATMYVVESRTGNNQLTKVPTSITFRVTNDIENIGAEISPKVWFYNEDSLAGATGSIAASIGPEVAGSFIPYTLTAADTSSFLTIPLTSGTAVTNGLDSGQYIVGWESVNANASGVTMTVANDASSGALQDNVTCFIDLGHDPGWGWVDVNPVIRLNLANLPFSTGIESIQNSTANFNVAPNPNNGLFKLTISTKVATEYTLNVRNMLGQSVYTDVINVNGSLTEQMDLTSYEKGVYFVSLENSSERLVKKVVVK